MIIGSGCSVQLWKSWGLCSGRLVSGGITPLWARWSRARFVPRRFCSWLRRAPLPSLACARGWVFAPPSLPCGGLWWSALRPCVAVFFCRVGCGGGAVLRGGRLPFFISPLRGRVARCASLHVGAAAGLGIFTRPARRLYGGMVNQRAL